MGVTESARSSRTAFDEIFGNYRGNVDVPVYNNLSRIYNKLILTWHQYPGLNGSDDVDKRIEYLLQKASKDDKLSKVLSKPSMDQPIMLPDIFWETEKPQ